MKNLMITTFAISLVWTSASSAAPQHAAVISNPVGNVEDLQEVPTSKNDFVDSTGTHWYHVESERLNFAAAQAECMKRGLILPTHETVQAMRQELDRSAVTNEKLRRGFWAMPSAGQREQRIWYFSPGYKGFFVVEQKSTATTYAYCVGAGR